MAPIHLDPIQRTGQPHMAGTPQSYLPPIHHLGTLLTPRNWDSPGGWRGSGVDTAFGGQVGWNLGQLVL